MPAIAECASATAAQGTWCPSPTHKPRPRTQVVMRDRQTGRPRGFGFVTFTAPEAADAVVEDIHIIDGRQVLPLAQRRASACIAATKWQTASQRCS